MGTISRLSKYFSKLGRISNLTSNTQSSSLLDVEPTKIDAFSKLDLHIEAPLYTYQPLAGERNIRVLEVYGTDSYDDILRFKILEVSLDSPPEYYAISYCWEGQTPSQKVLCEGQTLLVTINCEAALKQFRRKRDETIFLWIDAICINQVEAAVLERNHQVLMMGDVYATAAQVWVWLGTDRLKPLRRKTINMLNLFADLSKAANGSDGEAKVLKIVLSKATKDLTYIERDIPWFERIWIIQEVCLSKSAMIYRDKISIDFHGIIRALNMIDNCSGRNPALLTYRKRISFHFELFRKLVSQNETPGSSLKLRKLFGSARRYDSSDPRDKVFALHSLLSNAGLPLPPPDYSKDTGTVYRETAKTILLHEKNPGLLKNIHGLGQVSRLSSWSPNFGEREAPIFPAGLAFRVSGKSKPVYSFFSDNILFVYRGKVFDKVVLCAGVAAVNHHENPGAPQSFWSWTLNLQPREMIWKEYLNSAPELSRYIFEVWQINVLQNLISFVFSTSPTSQMEQDAYGEFKYCARSYIAGSPGALPHVAAKGDWNEWKSGLIGEFSNQASLSYSDSTPDILDSGIIWAAGRQKKILRDALKALKNSTVSSILQTSEFKILERICNNQTQAALHYAITSRIFYQTLFRTKNTNSLGMAPHSIREGDEIALLTGFDVPMVIRPLENGHYRMIAPACIYGIMKGEAWDEAWESEDSSVLQDLVFE